MSSETEVNDTLGTCPGVAATKAPLPYRGLCACPEPPSLPHFCLWPPERTSCGHQTASSPWIGFIMNTSPRLSWGFSSVSWRIRPGRTALGCSLATKKGSRSETGETPRQRAGRRVLSAAALSSARCVSDPYLCPTSELTRSLEGLPPTRSSGRSPAFSDWLLCLTANSNSQSDGPRYF